ncbi:uncharacterized protein N7458_006058 [Penicillium daleae]|uniref:T6SS Phospholipase effector Tle1-like catalytic domain-containing protein n=1 Tax=Penicillium daleae TaxID=63821 RepID=A0AAD6C4P7_9EURO|nr:uncharacterized protein N7458_006058 [Penicillium daleae]KAJ5449609.1 hypothetical protein N7458_006058 [Penicillium daleae]
MASSLEDFHTATTITIPRRPPSRDEIYLIGFSRGAFTARCIAQFINDVGLLHKWGLVNLQTLFGLWKKQDEVSDKDRVKTTEELLQLCVDLEKKGQLRRKIKIKVCAVWDTVSSLGLPTVGEFPQLFSRKLRFVGSDMCDSIQNGFQALSLHDHRRPFSPIVWKAPHDLGNRTLKQCWFVGYHSDVGGGYKCDGLAHLPLVWMMSQLKDYLWFDLASLWNKVIDEATLSHEKMHFTTRILLGSGLCEPPLSLKDSHVNILRNGSRNPRVVWTFGTSSTPRKEYEIEEDLPGSFEMDLLNEWLQRDLDEQRRLMRVWDERDITPTQEDRENLGAYHDHTQTLINILSEAGNPTLEWSSATFPYASGGWSLLRVGLPCLALSAFGILALTRIFHQESV